VGALADLSVFSLYPVKAMTNGEGGVITTERFEAAYQMRSFRNHGITSDHFERAQQGSWLDEMVDLSNYRHMISSVLLEPNLTTVNGSVPVPDFAPTPRRLMRRFCYCTFFQAWVMRMSMTLSRLCGRS
jgi:hypothetical protein